MQADKKKYITVALVSLPVVALDQITKYVICAMVPLHSRIELIPGFANIVHIRNTGIAFGLFKEIGSEWKTMMLLCITAVALALIGFLIAQAQQKSRLETVGLSMVLGGALGNLIDRLRLGEVVDFIDLHWHSTFHWPAFNVADSAITVGIALLAVWELSKIRKKPGADT